MFNHLLKPLSWLYGGITDVRNLLYDRKIISVLTPATYTIAVGNLTVGGTGKTPHVDYLVSLLKQTGPVATLSRGYGRQTRGFRVVTDADTADTVGDEPLLLYRKHGKTAEIGGADVLVSVGEKRAEAIPKLLTIRPDWRAIVLDDAFQHRPVHPQLNLLLMDYNRPFYADQPFPSGRLRERRHGALRADVVLVTKCPDELEAAEQRAIQQRIRTYSRADVPVFFTGLRYGKPVGFADSFVKNEGPRERRVVLVSGIARPEPLEQYVKTHFTLAGHLRFADHHRYTPADLERIVRELPGDGTVLTTEKDFVKLAPLLAETGLDASRFWYLPIEIMFLSGEAEFRQIVEQTDLDRPSQAGAGVKKI
ncbi:tetraacyldisaccharide 4'-kinase [Larkinella insperata]|uniref:Tetraacyldisaccharide 4'-kinase n=1 Tax=Larkinella insperata TaxID=332158 RepID=A0ABW3Q5Q4_9BACT|nr:tetraacyldisaccharide 4'-kinase [Larkinella insperata]